MLIIPSKRLGHWVNCGFGQFCKLNVFFVSGIFYEGLRETLMFMPFRSFILKVGVLEYPW